MLNYTNSTSEVKGAWLNITIQEMVRMSMNQKLVEVLSPLTKFFADRAKSEGLFGKKEVEEDGNTENR